MTQVTKPAIRLKYESEQNTHHNTQRTSNDKHDSGQTNKIDEMSHNALNSNQKYKMIKRIK